MILSGEHLENPIKILDKLRFCVLYRVEDIPHLLISLAVLYSVDGEGYQACAHHGQQTISIAGKSMELPWEADDVALASFAGSTISILFSIVSKTMQEITMAVANPDSPVSGLRQSLLDMLRTEGSNPEVAEQLRGVVASLNSNSDQNLQQRSNAQLHGSE